jgi:glucose-1-phosphate thymidylyltransferase
MKIIIPVAGKGTRLRPHTLTIPKVLMKIAGKPILGHLMDKIKRIKHVSEVVIVMGSDQEIIKDYLNKHYKLKFTYAIQDEPLGLGHAIHTGIASLKKLKEDVLVILGDTLFDVDLKKIYNSRHSVIAVKKVDDPRRFGVVEFGKDGFITRFVEKPKDKTVSKSNDAIVGIYYFKEANILKNALNYIIKNNIKTKNEYQVTDALHKMVDDKYKFKTAFVDGWLDCGKKETVLESNDYLLRKKRKVQLDFKGSEIIQPVNIHNSAIILNSVIGPNVSIGKNSSFISSTILHSIIGDECTIVDSKIKDSIIGNNSIVKKIKGILNLGSYSEIIA